MPAKTLTPAQLDKLLADIDAISRDPDRDRLVVLLSFKSGLRVAEIAALRWTHVRDAAGNLADAVQIAAGIKGGSGRAIPMHADVAAALDRLSGRQGCTASAAVVRGRNGQPMSANSLQRYLARLYARAGLEGCSSHSGRRTFITGLARCANAFGCSIRDVQRVAGHRHLASTSPYLEPSPGTAMLVRSL
jgi:integrase